jgi:hypothetical protein
MPSAAFRLIKDPLDRAVMQPELLGDGADAPVLGVEVTQDKQLLLRGNGQISLLVGGGGMACDRPGGGAESRAEQMSSSAPRNGSSVLPRGAVLTAKDWVLS